MSQTYTLKNHALEENIGYLIKRAGHHLSVTVGRKLVEFGMTHAQLEIFLKLLHGRTNTAAGLARELASDTGAMTRMPDRLEEKGFVERPHSSEDRAWYGLRSLPKENIWPIK